METIVIAIIILAILAYLFFDRKRSEENLRSEKMELIRELTVSLLSKKPEQYLESLPVYENKQEKDVVQDELVEIDQVEPEDLLNAIKEQ